MDASPEPQDRQTSPQAPVSPQDDISTSSELGTYQFVHQLLVQEPFLLYLGESDDRYIVRHNDELDLQVQKNRAKPEPFPAARTKLIRRAYLWLWMALVGLLFAGFGAMVFAMLAAVAVLGLNFQSISRADRVRSLVVLILSGASVAGRAASSRHFVAAYLMITRALFLSLGWLTISMLATLAGGTRLRRGHFAISAGWLLGVLLFGDFWALVTFGVPFEIALLTIVAFVFGLFCFHWFRDWNALGQVSWVTSSMTTVLFIVYAFQVTSFTPLNALSYLLAIVFFFIEALALIMALTQTYESLDATCRIHWKRRVDQLEPRSDYLPMVSLHVPAYNEPPEVVSETLKYLAGLDYPDYEVLVIDNNTPDSHTWRLLESTCRQLGPKFHFMHLEKWPGYKSGALNFALTQTDPRAEIIGSIDADYQLEASFLRELVPAFADPQMAFVQTPQDYRDYAGNSYLESTYHGYKYFFEVSMPIRNEHNAIIYAGTMGLIRKSVLAGDRRVGRVVHHRRRRSQPAHSETRL